MRFGVFAVLLSGSISLLAQGEFQAGDSMTGQFNLSDEAYAQPLYTPQVYFIVSAQGGIQENGGQLLFELFENSASESPIYAVLSSFPAPVDADGNPVNVLSVLYPVPSQSWPDRDGAFRFSVVSGAVNIDYLTFGRAFPIPNSSSYIVYSTTLFPEPIPIPEPSICALLACAALAMFLRCFTSCS